MHMIKKGQVERIQGVLSEAIVINEIMSEVS